MFCKNCGNKLDDKAKFCPQCGEKIEISPNCEEKAEQEEIKVTVSFAKEPEEETPTNKVAVVGMILAILGMFVLTLLPAFVCSTVGLIQGIKHKGEKLGHAIAGLCISLTYIIFILSFI